MRDRKKFVNAFLTCAAVASLLSGCASLDRIPMSSFEPFSDNYNQIMFKFRAESASLTYPEGSKEAEATRMEWLEEYLKLNNMCKQGYEIIERKTVVKAASFVGIAHTIYYTGKCTDGPSSK